MPNFDFSGTLKTLRAKKTELEKDLAKLQKAISAIEELGQAEPGADGRRKRRRLSAAARQKIARAQKLRWAKVRQAKGSKSE